MNDKDLREAIASVESVIKGKENVVHLSFTALLCGGHILFEDLPGTGKTTLAIAISKTIGCDFTRIQFTNDLMPSDILGTEIYLASNEDFKLRQGPIFTHILLADEINRATPRAQSALLEAMGEGRVSLGGNTIELPKPFFVIATQNPMDLYGTYPLPESQLDRFFMRLEIGYPEREDEAQIIINITSKDSEERLDFNVDPDLNREAFGNFFLNPERNICVRFNVTPVNWQRATGPEFLIIYPIIFKTQAEKLAKWKNQKGIRTKTVLIDSIGNNYYKIRDYIRKQRRKKSRLQYILILGDIELIASLDLNTENYRTRPCSRIPDYYFSTERDPKESKDVVLPVLTIGRLPVKKDDECETVVKQIIKYENDPPSEPDYYKRMVFAAYFQDFDEKENQNPDGKACRAYIKTMESIRDHMVKLGYRVERIYVSQTTDIKHYIDGTEVPSEVVCSIVDDDKAKKYLENAFEKGYLIIAHRDHGIPEGWSNPQFQKTDLKNLNCRFPSILYSINCHSGVFNWDCNLDSTKYDSFAEAILKKGGTTPSLIAANREAGTWLGNYFVKGLFDAIWGGILPTFGLSTDNCPLKYKRLGDIQNYAKTYLPLRFRGRSEDIRKLCFEAFHVIGDPTLELWTKEPRKNQIKIRLEGFNLHIKLSYCPINSVLTIWHKEERIKRIEPSSTSLTISLQNIFKDDKVKPDISVCFSAPGWRFKEVKPEAIDE